MGWGGYGKGGYGWGFPPMMMGYGKGKGKGLRGFSNEKKVWIGGFEAGQTDIEEKQEAQGAYVPRRARVRLRRN